ncbi:MAG: AraC family transcriptional regulator [Clostridia bacterium]|nr:AraC family transcriptional regulator [Clostridia bacterium]
MENQNEIHAKALHSICDKSGKLLFQYKIKEMNSGYFDTRLHNHDELKIVRILKGSCIWNINGTDFSVNIGDILLFNRLDIRFIKEITSSDPLVVCQYCFSPIAIMPNLSAANCFYHRPEEGKNLLTNGSPMNDELTPYFGAISDEIEQKKSYHDEMILNLLSNMVLHLARYFSEGVYTHISAYQSELISETVDYINKNPSADLTLGTLAFRTHTSPAYFSRTFKAYTGVGLKEYVTQSRVIHVITLMHSNPHSNIIDLAFASGFNTSSGFYKAFEKITGSSPKKILQSKTGFSE